jgi:hypothetical protein
MYSVFSNLKSTQGAGCGESQAASLSALPSRGSMSAIGRKRGCWEMKTSRQPAGPLPCTEGHRPPMQ